MYIYIYMCVYVQYEVPCCCSCAARPPAVPHDVQDVPADGVAVDVPHPAAEHRLRQVLADREVAAPNQGRR